MLDVVSVVGKGRVSNCCCMAIQTGSLGVHTAGGVMVYVMGEQVKGRTVIYSAVTTGTVAAASSACGCWNQAVVVGTRIGMTGGTGVMDSVIAAINRESGSYRRVMAGIAVTGNRQGHTTGGNVVDGVRTGIGIMTGLAVSTAAGTR